MSKSMKRLRRFLILAVTEFCIAAAAHAAPVGERHLLTTDATAALRDAQGRSQVRVTVWYPAADGALEKRIDIGPPDNPLFRIGAVAANAPFVDAKRRPVILFSHGFGGTARLMAWFGAALARHGFVVVAVDHPGNNGLDTMTPAGAMLSWDRVEDLQAALNAAESDPAIGPHIDRERLGVSGFSAGGFATLVSAGAAVDIQRFQEFCKGHPTDGVCAPQKEFALSQADAERVLKSPALAAEAAHAGDDHRIPGVRAAFAMAPAIVQALPPEGLAKINVPVAIILGDADPVAPPQTNGLVAAREIPHADLKVLPGVGHYDFIALCAPAGTAILPACQIKAPQEPTHQAAIAMALALFDHALGKP